MVFLDQQFAQVVISFYLSNMKLIAVCTRACHQSQHWDKWSQL